ncbi:unnamed protein product [Gadus morhua 'NCC']
MDVLAKAAVSEISQLFSDGSATLRLQITQSREENEALRTRMKEMRSELFSLRLQTRTIASHAASRFALARANTCTPRTISLGNEDCEAFGDGSTKRGATLDSLHVDPPGSSHVSSHNKELRILSVHGQGEGPLAVDGHDTLFTASKLEALYSPSAHYSVAKSLDVGEQLVRRMELTVQVGNDLYIHHPTQTPDTILIKDEEDIGGGLPAVEVCNDIRDCSTTSDSLHPDATGSFHMSSHNRELRILSVHGQGGGQLVVDSHDTLFTASEVEALSSLSMDHSVAKSLDCSEQIVHCEEQTGSRGGRKGQPCVLCGKVFPSNSKMTIHMRTHTSEKPYRCAQCMKRFSQSCNLKIHMSTHSREKPYRCDQCMKRFRQSYDLKIHMRIHSGEKPCMCLQCKASFSDPRYLRLHRINAHGNEVL